MKPAATSDEDSSGAKDPTTPGTSRRFGKNERFPTKTVRESENAQFSLC